MEGFGFPAIDVDCVAHGLECVKADAQRQHQVQHWPRPNPNQVRRRIAEKVGVFEQRQDAEIETYGRDQSDAPAPRVWMVRRNS